MAANLQDILAFCENLEKKAPILSEEIKRKSNNALTTLSADEIIKILVGHSMTDQNGWTPLLWAYKTRHYSIFKLLCAHPDIDINARQAPNQKPWPFGNPSGLTVLIFAAKEREPKYVKLLLAVPTIDVKASHNGTPLMHATVHGSTEIVELLLDAPGLDLEDILTSISRLSMPGIDCRSDGNLTARGQATLDLLHHAHLMRFCRNATDISADELPRHKSVGITQDNARKCLLRLVDSEPDLEKKIAMLSTAIQKNNDVPAHAFSKLMHECWLGESNAVTAIKIELMRCQDDLPKTYVGGKTQITTTYTVLPPGNPPANKATAPNIRKM